MPSSCSRGITSFQIAIYSNTSPKELVKRTTTQQLVCHCRRECSLEPMENNSTSRSNEKQPLEHSTPANGETNKHTEKENSTSAFVNQAAIAWHESRRKWTGDQSRRAQRTTKDPVISWSTTYEDLLSTNERFLEPIPLPKHARRSFGSGGQFQVKIVMNAVIAKILGWSSGDGRLFS